MPHTAPAARAAWWFDACDPGVAADLHRRSVLLMAVDGAGQSLARFESGIAIGDLVVAGDAGQGRLLVGEVDGEALRRPGIHRLDSLRSVRWLAEVPESSADPALLAALRDCAAVSRLDDAWREAIESLAAAQGHGPGDAPLHFDVDCRPPPIELPWLPSLYQSPHAERILREFRWREYLLANPDVAGACADEASAFSHFFHQGYYERRIFDPLRLSGFDPGYYRERYPELALASDAQAQIHYCYAGWYEHRVPNRDTAWLHDADLHVFQMGKVGSHTIASALRDAGYAGRVLHLHWVTDVVTGYPSNRLPYANLLVHPRDEPVKVLSAAREIVSWTLSSLFQYHGTGVANPVDAVAMVEERFWQLCRNGLDWFDHGYFCGLDVYRHPFSHEAGFTRIAHGGIDLLVYRQEDLPRLAPALGDFMGLPALYLSAHNVGGDKGYSGVYARVMREFRLPGNLLSTIYDSPYMRHFYSDAEREAGYARWRRRD